MNSSSRSVDKASGKATKDGSMTGKTASSLSGGSEKGDGKKSRGKPKKASQDPMETSHDSAATGATGARGSPTQDTNHEGDAQGALKAILWEAGLSKNEVSKRTKLQNGDLVELDLERCEQLTTLPPQIGRLVKLRTLNLSGCKELVTLPPEIGKLSELRELYLTNCNDLVELPPELGMLRKLTELYLTNCWNLKSLPPEIGKLESLNELYLTGCKQLMELPPELGQLSNLTELKLFSCKQLQTLPPEIGQLNRLTKLDLRLCEALSTLPSEVGQLSKLTALNLTGCTHLVELPGELGNLKKLTELILKDCKELASLPSEITQLSQLTELNCDGCTKLKKLAPELRRLSNPRKASAKAAGQMNFGLAKSPDDKSQSGLDIMRMAAAHLEKVPENARRSSNEPRMLTPQEANMYKATQVAEALDDKYFQNVPSPPPPDEVIDSVGENDVLCGRGGETNHHPGNVKYRNLVKQHQLLYIEAKRLDKPRIALKIVNLVRKSGGRFLKKEGVIGTWRDVGNQKAREKTSQTLREGAPELRDPSLPQSQLIPPGRYVELPPLGEPIPDEISMESALQAHIQKRKAESLAQQPSRKKYKLPLHPRTPVLGHGSPPMGTGEDEDFQSDPDLTDPMLRGPRLQVLKARHSSPSDPTATPAPSIGGPSSLDVVYGKGKAIQDHVGNIRFRKIVDMHRQSYHSAFRRADKTQISKDIVQWIRSMGGRFLQLDFSTGKYHDVGDECARDKVSHALRSRKDVHKRPPKPATPKNNFIPTEERERIMAYTMGIVRNLQNQDQEDVERTYYQKMHSGRSEGGPMPGPPPNGPDPAVMMAPVPGDPRGMGGPPPNPASNGVKPVERSSSEPRGEGTRMSGEAMKTAPGDWPLRDIVEPHENDVLYGRGGKSNHHPGNKRYRSRVKNREWDYLRRKNKDKQWVAMEIVREWRNQSPPGRFLKKDDATGLWHDVGDQKAREKTSQAFRENAPHHPPPMFHAALPPARPMPNMAMPQDMEMMWRSMPGPYPPPSNSNADTPGSQNKNKAEV